MSFNIKNVVRAALRSDCRDANPHSIAKAIVDRLSDDEVREALRYCLPAVVRSAIHKDSDRVSGRAGHGGETVPAPPANAVESIRWQRVCVAPRTWKFLGDCTEDDLQSMGEFCDDLQSMGEFCDRVADDKTRERNTYYVLADRLAGSPVARVGQLPDDDLVDVVLGGNR